jgi:cytochrome P450
MGETAALFPPNTHEQYYVAHIKEKYNLPDVFYLDVWPIAQKQVAVTGPEASKAITVTNPHPMHDAVDEHLEALIGKDVIAGANGTTWKLLHQMMAPSFTPAATKAQLPWIAEQTLLFHRRMGDLATSGELFRLEDELAKLIFDILGLSVLGVKFGAQEKGSPQLGEFAAVTDLHARLWGVWNPITKYRLIREREWHKKKTNIYMNKVITDRFNFLKQQDEQVTLKTAKCILDRLLSQQLETGGDLNPKVYTLIQDKYGFLPSPPPPPTTSTSQPILIVWISHMLIYLVASRLSSLAVTARQRMLCV